MRVWVCRGITGDYCLFHPECKPVNMGMSQWACKCRESHFIFLMSAENFKALTGIPNHLSMEESRLMEWNPPLREAL